MRSSVRVLPLFVASAALAACFSDANGTTTTVGGGTAYVQFVDATNQSLNFEDAINTSINQTIGFGGTSVCFPVNANVPGLLITPGMTGGLSEVPLTNQLLAGDTTFVTVMTQSASTLQYAVFYQPFTPAAGQAGLRVINAAPSLGDAGQALDAYVTASGATLGTPAVTNIIFPTDNGPQSGYVNVAPGTFDVSVTDNGTKTVVADAGDVTFSAGQLTTVVVADPAVNTIPLRAFVAITNCLGEGNFSRVRGE